MYFAALGLGFMFFEITMIQRLVQFLGYPTYSLTVTLASMLVSTGHRRAVEPAVRRPGAPRDARPARGARRAHGLLPVRAPDLAHRLAALDGPRRTRARRVARVLAPLGLCLGMFMPLGLGRVAALTDHGEEYVAWAWAVNGFFSVIGSVLTTILSMTFGFRAGAARRRGHVRDRGAGLHAARPATAR